MEVAVDAVVVVVVEAVMVVVVVVVVAVAVEDTVEVGTITDMAGDMEVGVVTDGK